MATNTDTIMPLSTAKRWSRVEKKYVNIQQPHLFNSYNKFMGGVDKHDWLVSKYNISIRGKKWYWPIITRLIDMSIVNSWTLYRKIHGQKSLSLLEFRRAIVTCYLQSQGRKRKTVIMPTILDVRTDATNHWIGKHEKQRRCQYKDCKKKPLTYCKKCEKTLCIECFEPYHL